MSDTLGWSDPRWAKAGITPRRLDHWTTKGWLHTAGDDPNPGSGGKRLWPISEFHVAARMVKLIDLGFLPAAAAELARDPQLRGKAVEVLTAAGT